MPIVGAEDHRVTGIVHQDGDGFPRGVIDAQNGNRGIDGRRRHHGGVDHEPAEPSVGLLAQAIVADVCHPVPGPQACFHGAVLRLTDGALDFFQCGGFPVGALERGILIGNIRAGMRVNGGLHKVGNTILLLRVPAQALDPCRGKGAAQVADHHRYALVAGLEHQHARVKRVQNARRALLPTTVSVHRQAQRRSDVHLGGPRLHRGAPANHWKHANRYIQTENHSNQGAHHISWESQGLITRGHSTSPRGKLQVSPAAVQFVPSPSLSRNGHKGKPLVRAVRLEEA